MLINELFIYTFDNKYIEQKKKYFEPNNKLKSSVIVQISLIFSLGNCSL
jgi:hypothetical protein